MDNVIEVDFRSTREKMISKYLKMLADYGLDEDDLVEVAAAIRSYEAYENSDEVVQRFVDEFHYCA